MMNNATKKRSLRLMAAICVFCILTPVLTPLAASIFFPATTAPAVHTNPTFNPNIRTLRIGLNFGTTALPSANLQNAAGHGSGFQFGFFDSDRNFIHGGAYTQQNRISMLMSRNMVWHPGEGAGAGQYREGTSGNVVVGRYHIQLATAHSNFHDARNAADALGHSERFIRFHNGSFFVNIGNFTTRDAATAAMNALSIADDTSIISGSDRAITVVATGTRDILFKFDFGATHSLAVNPIAAEGVSAETWFAGFRYNGAFRYERRAGGLITVVNYVEIEDYVRGVVPYEMNPNWHIEALKAQAVSARTYALAYINRHSAHGFDLCTTEHCQVYRGRNSANANSDRSVVETAGLVLMYGDTLAIPYYASSNGGASENVENVWLNPMPHLRAVFDPFEASIAYRIAQYNWTINFTQAEITERLRTRGNFNNAAIATMEAEYTAVGNVVAVIFRDVNGNSFRVRGRDALNNVLGVRSIRFNIGGTLWFSGSGPGTLHANDPIQTTDGPFFAIGEDGEIVPVPEGTMFAIDGEGNTVVVDGGGVVVPPPLTSGRVNVANGVTIRGTGFGHNVGMSQWGALAQAELYGRNFRQILEFYFTGVEVR